MGNIIQSQPGIYREIPVTIASGASLSGIVALDGYVPVAINMPAAWTAANLTFQGSHDGVTFNDVYDGTTERTVTAAAARYLPLPTPGTTTPWDGFPYLKIRSGTAGVPVNQAAARTLWLVCRAK